MFTQRGEVCNLAMRTTLIAFHFTVILLSRVNDKDKQQVCYDLSISLWEC